MSVRYETRVYRVSLANWHWVVYSVRELNWASSVAFPVASGRAFTEAGGWAAARRVELSLMQDDRDIEEESTLL